MANLFFVNVYQINQKIVDGSVQSLRLGFPTSGCVIQDITASPTRSLSSGYNVYSVIIRPSAASSVTQNGDYMYVQESAATLATLIG